MNKDYLLKTAKSLKQVSIKSADIYKLNTDKLVHEINERMIERVDIEELVGSNISMMKDNHSNHVRFIYSILKNYNAEVFVETVLWVFRAYRSHGFSTNYWAAQLNSWIAIIGEVLDEDTYNDLYPYYQWMQVNIPIFVMLSDEKLENQNLMH